MIPRLALFGISGRMGRAVLTTLTAAGDVSLSGGTTSSGSVAADIGSQIAGATISADPSVAVRGASAAIDFSQPAAVSANLAACAAQSVPLVIAVTGLDPATQAAITAAARTIPIVQAANTSLGLTVMRKLAALAAAALPLDFDIEINEAHHRMKRDAPSGTALALGEAVARSRGTTLAQAAVYARHGAAALRTPGSIGFSVIRAGDIVGVHTVLFGGDDETVEITHRVSDRVCFARGAVLAARWLIGRPAGLYAMDDVLGV